MKRISGIFIGLILFLLSTQYSLLYAQQITVSPQPLYFGITPDGRDTFRQMVVRNTSGETLNISQITIQGTNSGEFSIVDNPGSLNLSAYGRTEITLKFTPSSSGDKQAQIVFTSNAASSPDNIDLFAGASDISSGLITFEKILGTIEGDGASDVRSTADGGFIIAGNTFNDDEEKNDGYLMKTNAYGEILWTEVYDGDDNDDNNDGFSSVIEVSDGYIAVGKTDINDNDRNDIWVVKTDLSGIFKWDIIFGGTDDDGASVIESTDDSNFIIAGFTRDANGVKGNDGYLLKINGAGTELWSKIIGGSDGERFSSVKQTDDGGYIISGTISTGGLGSDMYLVKTNAAGQVSWEKQYGDTGEDNADRAGSVVIASDGGFVLAGRTTSSGAGANDVYVIKTDANGVKDQTWGDKTFGEAHHDGAAEIISTSNGGFLVVGSIENFYEPLPQNEWYSDVYILKLDQNGNKEWDQVYGGDRNESASSVRELSDGSFIISGGTGTYGSNGDGDIYLLRVNSGGEITAISNDRAINVPTTFSISQNYPNPFNNQTRIDFYLPRKSNVKISKNLPG